MKHALIPYSVFLLCPAAPTLMQSPTAPFEDGKPRNSLRGQREGLPATATMTATGTVPCRKLLNNSEGKRDGKQSTFLR